MATVSAQTNLTLPKGHESSSLRSHRDSDDARSQWKRHNQIAKQVKSAMEALDQQARLLEKMRRRILGGAGGATGGWHKPTNSLYEADPTYSYDEGSVIHIQATDALVTTGIRDASNLIADPSGATGSPITSCAGFWVATQDVPAKTNVGGNDFWNLPQFPLPVPTNIDDPTNFWIYLGDITP
jgi:hypothetical protein